MARWWEDYDPAVDEDWDDAETNEDPFADADPADDQEADEARGVASRGALRQASDHGRRW